MSLATFLLSVCIAHSIFYHSYASQCSMHNSPGHISFVEQNAGTGVSDLLENVGKLFGLSMNDKDSAVPLFQTTKPFDIPVSTWLFYIRGLDSLFDYGIPLLDDSEFDFNPIKQKFSAIGNENGITEKTISIQTSSELQNLQQQLAEAISTTGEKITDKPTIKYIIVDCVYCNSEGVVNNDFVNNLQKQFNTTIQQVVARDPKVLALSLTTPSIHHRQRRAVADHNITIATMYSDQYPVMFNIFFWTSLVLFLTLLVITYVFWTMDPAKDTIIYRMTTPRVKLD